MRKMSHIISRFKSFITKHARDNDIPFMWQARFYDTIIRNPADFIVIDNYIKNNISNWKDDDYYSPSSLQRRHSRGVSSKIQLDATSYQQHHFLIQDKIYRCFSDATFFLSDATGVTYSTLLDAMNRFPSFAFLCGFARIFCRTFGTLIYLANLLCRDSALRASSPAYALSSFQDFFESQKLKNSKSQKFKFF